MHVLVKRTDYKVPVVECASFIDELVFLVLRSDGMSVLPELTRPLRCRSYVTVRSNQRVREFLASPSSSSTVIR